MADKGKITKIEAQQNNAQRCSLFVDGEFLLGIDAKLIAEYDLSTGQRMTENLVDQLLAEEELATAKQAAFRLLSYRQRSRQEFKERLAQKGFANSVIQQVVTVLDRLDYIDDRDFAASWIQDRITRGFGPYRIRKQLQEKGVSSQIIEEEIEQEYNFDLEYQLASKLAAKKKGRYDNLSLWKQKGKLKQVLQRKGFSFEVIDLVLKDVLEEE
ncbi:RecX family transcriptional regulator [Halanaerobaculum tunisiense]